MDNELRKKRVLEGIKLLEQGKDPFYIRSHGVCCRDYYGVTWDGFEIIFNNNLLSFSKATHHDARKHGFKQSTDDHIPTMLHNWKRFYELIEKL